MKRLIMIFLCVFLLAGSAQATLTIEGMTLWGGTGTTFFDGSDPWVSNGQIWTTTNSNGWWVLGVSSTPGASLLNSLTPGPTYTTISGLDFGNYYLYAEPTDLGSNPQLQVYLSNNLVNPIAAIFQLSGPSGVANTWTQTAGAGVITLGWAAGTADLVGSGQSMVPSGANDFYLKAGVSNPYVVPLPGAVWLLGSGLVGLAGLRRRFGR